MTARRPHEPGAGPWVAWQDRPHPGRNAEPGQRLVSYLWLTKGPFISWTTKAADGLRFDTKAEALAAVRAARPRTPGIRTGATRIGSERLMDEPKKRGSLVRDRDGHLWKRGTTRWTCQTPVDGVRVTNVGRLGWVDLGRMYGPLSEVEAR